MSWRTPPAVFGRLHEEFRFTVDGCSNESNALLDRHWTEGDEPLLRSWEGERVFINPPYGRQIARWMEKAWTESAHAFVVALVPSRTDTAWWHDYVMKASEIRFIRGRLEFSGHAKKNPQSHNAPFPSAIVVWNGRQTSGPGSSVAVEDGAEQLLGHHETVEERQGRQPGLEELHAVTTELARWSRVAELNGDLHARLASALVLSRGAAE